MSSPDNGKPSSDAGKKSSFDEKAIITAGLITAIVMATAFLGKSLRPNAPDAVGLIIKLKQEKHTPEELTQQLKDVCGKLSNDDVSRTIDMLKIHQHDLSSDKKHTYDEVIELLQGILKERGAAPTKR